MITYNDKEILKLYKCHSESFPSVEEAKKYPEAYEWFNNYGLGWFTEMDAFDGEKLRGVLAFLKWKEKQNK